MKQEGLLIGIHPIREALDSGKEFQKVLLQQGGHSDRIQELIKELKALDVPVQRVPKEKMNRVTRKNHQGILAFVSPVSFHPLEEHVIGLFEAGVSPLYLAMEGVTDIRNFGAIVRTVEGMGFHGVLMPSIGMAPINAEAIKSSSGALLRVPLIRMKDTSRSYKLLQQCGLQIIGLTEKGTESISDVTLDGPLCLVMGNEFSGLQPKTLQIADKLLRIPMHGTLGSFNVGVSAAIAMYEVQRQRF